MLQLDKKRHEVQRCAIKPAYDSTCGAVGGFGLPDAFGNRSCASVTLPSRRKGRCENDFLGGLYTAVMVSTDT
jgi:hypothetical protein